jgi:hypothetical protein
VRVPRHIQRGIALWSAVALIGTSIAISAGGAIAAVGSLQGTVSGTGSFVDANNVTQTVSIDATTNRSNPASGTFSISDGTLSSDGDVTCLFLKESSAVVGVHLSFGPGSDLYGLVFITDGGPAGPDTLGLTDPTPGEWPADCTSEGSGSPLSSGDFTIAIDEPPLVTQAPTETPAPPTPESSIAPSGDPVSGDGNGDGIDDGLQPAGTPFGSFVDASLDPPTVGSVVSSGGLSVTIVDSPDPLQGVLVTVGSEVPGAQAELSVCGGFTVLLDAGTQTTGTCGSVTLQVVYGGAQVVLGGGITVVSVPAGGAATIEDLGDGSFEVTNAGTEPVAVTVDGTTTVIEAGDDPITAGTTDFVGFAPPIDNAPVLNRVKAGQVVPIKWRVLHAGGAPVTDLLTAGITVAGLNCAVGATIDQVETTVASSSALKNLGDGYYQLNWQSSRTFAGSCRTLRLDIGDGVTHDALFQFTK